MNNNVNADVREIQLNADGDIAGLIEISATEISALERSSLDELIADCEDLMEDTEQREHRHRTFRKPHDRDWR